MSARTPVAPAASLAGEARHLWHLAWPMSLGMLALMAMGIEDTVLVGRLGGDAMATVAISMTWYFGVVIVAIGALRAIDPLVSQALGAGDRAAAGRALGQGIGLCLALTPPIAAMLLFAEPGLRALGQPEHLLGTAGRYTRLLVLSVPGSLAFNLVRQVLQGIGRVRAAAVVIIAANVLNVAVVAGLLYGVETGPLGCAAGLIVTNTFMAAALTWFERDALRELRPPEGWWAHVVPGARHLAPLGVPLGVQMGMEVWAFTGAGLLMGSFGATPIAAHAVVMNLASVSFMVPLGVGNAVSTRVGHLIGAGQPWQRAAQAGVAMGAGVMLVSGVVYSLFPAPLVRLFTDDVAVVTLAATLLPIAGAFQLFDGTQVTAFGVLRGAGDVRMPSLANLVGYWVLGLPLGAWLAYGLGWGPKGVWVGLAVGLAVVAVLLVFRVVALARRGVTRI